MGMVRCVKTLLGALLGALIVAAPANAGTRGTVQTVATGIVKPAQLNADRAATKARSVVQRLKLAAFADTYEIRDCARLSARTITCRYTLGFNDLIPACEDRITLTTRWTRGERYIGWAVGKDAIECSAGLDVSTVEVAP